MKFAFAEAFVKVKKVKKKVVLVFFSIGKKISGQNIFFFHVEVIFFSFNIVPIHLIVVVIMLLAKSCKCNQICYSQKLF